MKTTKTQASVREFLAAVPNETRRKDAQTLAKLFTQVTGWKARMWGPSIVGFGTYHYTYETGRSGEMCVVGFSPRKASLVVYGGGSPAAKDGLLKKLGKHQTNGGCIYINALADVDLAVLKKVIASGVAATQKRWPVTPS